MLHSGFESSVDRDQNNKGLKCVVRLAARDDNLSLEEDAAPEHRRRTPGSADMEIGQARGFNRFCGRWWRLRHSPRHMYHLLQPWQPLLSSIFLNKLNFISAIEVHHLQNGTYERCFYIHFILV